MFWIDVFSRKPVYEQLIEQTEKLILSSMLGANEQMPSVRALSGTLSVNPNTIQKAYNILDRRGIVRTVPGKGVFVTPDAYSILCRENRQKLSDFDAVVHDLALANVSEQELCERIRQIYKTISQKEVKDND